jgi:hypothetical protein
MISRPTWPAWTIAGILLALLAGTMHAFVLYLLDLKTVGKSPEFMDGFGADGYSGA